MALLLVDSGASVSDSGMCYGWSCLSPSSCEANKISHEPMLAPSQHQDDPFLHGVLRRNFCGRTIFWLRYRIPLFLSTWSWCHSFRSLRTNGGPFFFCPTFGFWFALTTFRTCPMWESSFCALTIHHFYLIATCLWQNIYLMELPVVVSQGSVSTWQSLNSTDWGLQAFRTYPLSTTIHVVLEVGWYPGKTISISVQLAWSIPYFKVEVRELSNPPQPRGIQFNRR